MRALCEKLSPLVPLILRIGLGVTFVYHGFSKTFGDGTSFGTSWNPGEMAVVVQALVAWGELLCGLAILGGFMVPLAALGIIIIMTGAIIMVHGKNGFNMMNHGFEYNFVLIMMSIALMGTGAGPCSIESKCCK